MVGFVGLPVLLIPARGWLFGCFFTKSPRLSVLILMSTLFLINNWIGTVYCPLVSGTSASLSLVWLPCKFLSLCSLHNGAVEGLDLLLLLQIIMLEDELVSPTRRCNRLLSLAMYKITGPIRFHC